MVHATMSKHMRNLSVLFLGVAVLAVLWWQVLREPDQGVLLHGDFKDGEKVSLTLSAPEQVEVALRLRNASILIASKGDSGVLGNYSQVDLQRLVSPAMFAVPLDGYWVGWTWGRTPLSWSGDKTELTIMVGEQRSDRMTVWIVPKSSPSFPPTRMIVSGVGLVD